MTEAALDYGDLFEGESRGWRSRLIALLLTGAVVAGAATGVWWEFWRGGSSTTAAAQTATADRGNITKSVSTSGVVAAQQTSSLSFQQSGKVTAVNVKLGQTVKQDDVLAEVDPTDLQAALDTANSNLASARSKLNQLIQGSTASQLAAADQSVVQAQAAYDKAVRALQTLQQPPTATDLGSAQQAVAAAQAQVATATQARAKVDQANQDAISAAQAAVTKAQTALNHAESAESTAAATTSSAEASLFAAETAYCPDATVSFCSSHSAPLSSADESALLTVSNSGTPAQAAAASKVLTANTAYGKAVNDQQTANDAVTSAQNDLTTAQNSLAKAQQGPTAADIAAADAAINTAQASVASAQAKLATLQAGPTQDQLAQAQSDIDTANAGLTAAQSKRDETYRGSLPSDIQQQQSAVAQQQIAVNTAQRNLDKTKLTAPFDGTVAVLNVQVGDTAAGGGSSSSSASSSSASSSAAMVLNTPDAVRIDLTVTETDLPNVKVGQNGTAQFDAIPGATFPLLIDAIGTNPTTTQGVVTYAVRAHIVPRPQGNTNAAPAFGTPPAGGTAAGNASGTPTSGRGGRNGGAGGTGGGGAGGAGGQGAASTAKPVPGMNARITIISDQRQNVVRLSSAAIQRQGGASFVQVKQSDGSTQKVTVETGLSDGQQTEITSGIDEGAVVLLPSATVASSAGSAAATPRTGGGGGFGGGGGGRGGGAAGD